ncbi:hypothetical protein E4T42_04341 [Aureobasidium subglaciale]|nr:hypothetical protein E4T42_04341 [Aureobasidium subglaciale]
MSPIREMYAILVTVLFFQIATSSSNLESQELEARNGGGGWTNAYWMTQQGLTAATQAQCPSWSPINCNAIQEPDYCCTPNTYCARASDNTIGCCPWGQTCTPNIAGAGAGAGGGWQQHPTPTWQQQPSTVYVTEGHATTTVVYAAGQNTQGYTTQQQTGYLGQGQGQYCSTLYAHGDNLPTTEVGTCGTILIANKASREIGISKWVMMGSFWVVAGGMILQARAWM